MISILKEHLTIVSKSNTQNEIEYFRNTFMKVFLFVDSFSGRLITKNSEFHFFIYRNPNWWPRRTALEKSLIIISILALIGIIVLVISLSGILAKKKDCESK